MDFEEKISHPKSGEVWMCKLPKSGGSIQEGYRPVLIMSNDQNNAFSTTLNVIPITSRTGKKSLPVHVTLSNYCNYGLKKPSVLLVEQMTTIQNNILDRCVGKIDDEKTLNSIEKAMTIQFPILDHIRSK